MTTMLIPTITYQKPGDKSESKHTGWLMHEYFKDQEAVQKEAKADEITFDYEYREFGNLTLASAKEAKDEEEVSQPHIPIENWNKLLRLRRHARPLHLQQNEEIARKVDYGDMVHQVLEEIRYADELESVLEKQQLRGDLSADDAALLKAKLEGLFNNETIKDWFSQNWEDVLNEQPIQDKKGNIYRPDSILLKDKQAIVIDYKTGKKSDSHREQVQKYMQLLSELGYSQVSGFLLYLEEDGETVEEVQIKETLTV